MHPSNFKIEGFTERPALGELVGLGRRLNVPVVEDLGSGYLRFAPSVEALRDEPDVRASVAAGTDLVLFSGDKLLGGPQAGIIVGRTEPVAAVRRHPLMRALRVDKLTCAALEGTLGELVAGRAAETVPVTAMIALSSESIGRRAEALTARLASSGVRSEIVDGYSTIGGGSAPGSALPTRLIALHSDRAPATAVEAALRRAAPPVIARIEDGRVVFDLRRRSRPARTNCWPRSSCPPSPSSTQRPDFVPATLCSAATIVAIDRTRTRRATRQGLLTGRVKQEGQKIVAIESSARSITLVGRTPRYNTAAVASNRPASATPGTRGRDISLPSVMYIMTTMRR